MTSSLTALLLSLTTILSGMQATLNNLSVNPTKQVAQVVSSQKSVLTPADFSYQGYYDVRLNNIENSYLRSLTHRYVNGELRFLTITHNGNLIEFSIGNNSYGSTITTVLNTWNGIPGTDNHTGLWFNSATNQLWVTSSVDYTNIYADAHITMMTLGSNGTVSNVKKVNISGIPEKRMFGGCQAVPADYQSITGSPYVCGWGGYTSLVAQAGGASMGPAMYAIPDPANISNNGFLTARTLLDAVGDRGLRATTPINYFDNGACCGVGPPNGTIPHRPSLPPHSSGQWLSPDSSGKSWFVWGDSYFNNGMFIETPTKQGFVAVAGLCKGACWYGMSTLNTDERTQELHIWDVNRLDDGILTRPNSMTELQLARGYTWYPWNGNMGSTGQNISGSTYDSVTGKVYMAGFPMGSDGYTGRIYVYQVGGGGTGIVPTTSSTPTTSTNNQIPVDATVSSWSAWVDTSGWSTCSNSTQTKTQQRTRTVVTPATNGGSTPTLTETQTVSQSCTTSTTNENTNNPTGYTNCSSEGGTCNFSGTKSVAYGANGVFVYGTFTNGVSCTNSVFGDPIYGTYKYCSTKDIVATTSTTPTSPAQTNESKKFVIGDTIKTTATVNVRAVGGGTLLGTQTTGNTGTIVDGPTYSNSVTWWKIDYTSGIDGWSGDNYLSKYLSTSGTTQTPAILSEWSEWTLVSDWSVCTDSIQYKTEQRNRTVLTPATNGGTTGALSETRTLSQSCIEETENTPTPVDATVSEWSNWTPTGEWSVCTNNTQTRTEQRNRTVLTPAENGGSVPTLTETQTATQSCTTTTTPTETPTITTTTQKLTKDIYLGVRDAEVKILQDHLINKGYLRTGLNTGYFGYSTYNAVRSYQRAKSIRATGYVGSQTRRVVNAEL